MKDLKGYQRGKCSSCECDEYMPPPLESTPGRLRCEYCNHTPGEHVRIISLGGCSKCGEDNCDKYEPEDDKSYSVCQYCGCDAVYHAGAEKLRKKAPMASSVLSKSPAEVNPRLDSRGAPAQTLKHGTCKRPECNFPRRIEKDQVLDYCSRTCAQKDITTPSKGAWSSPKPPSVSSTTRATFSDETIVKESQHKVCEKCKTKPANLGHKWCESCYSSSIK